MYQVARLYGSKTRFFTIGKEFLEWLTSNPALYMARVWYVSSCTFLWFKNKIFELGKNPQSGYSTGARLSQCCGWHRKFSAQSTVVGVSAVLAGTRYEPASYSLID